LILTNASERDKVGEVVVRHVTSSGGTIGVLIRTRYAAKKTLFLRRGILIY
jgi:hypothetical protein